MLLTKRRITRRNKGALAAMLLVIVSMTAPHVFQTAKAVIVDDKYVQDQRYEDKSKKRKRKF